MSGYDLDNEGKPRDTDGITTGKKTKKKVGAPGKAAGTDNYGEGGPNGAAPVPGKAAGTDPLPAGPNGANGKKFVQKNDGGANAGPTEVPKAIGGDELDAAAPTAKPNGKATKKAKGDGKAADAAAAGDKDAKAKPKAQAGHDISAPPAVASTAVQAKPTQTPMLAFVPSVTPAEPVTVAPLGGAKPDPAHDSLKAEVSTLNAVIAKNREEILSLGKTLQQQVAGTLDAHAAAIDAKVTAGSKRVVDAYDGIDKALTDSNTKAQTELKKREESIPQVIKQARDKKAADLIAISTKTKETTKQNVMSPEKVAAAHKVGLTFAKDIDAKREALNARIDGFAGPGSKLAAELNPKKAEWSVEGKKGSEARELGVQALAADKQLALLTQSAKGLRTAVDTSMKAFSTRYTENGQNLITEALAAEDADLQPVLDIRQKEQEKSLDTAAVGATDLLKKQIVETRGGLDKTTKQATARVAAERKPAEDGAKRAGQALSENIKNGAKEIGNQIEKKAAGDATSYNQALEQLRTIANAKKLDPAAKAKLDQLKEQLTKAHEENKTALQQLATTGIAEMKSQKEQEYEQAISGYEQAATKTKTDLVQKVEGATGDIAKSFDTIGTSFEATVAAETKKLEGTLSEYTQKTKGLPETFKTQLAAKLEMMGGALNAQIEKALNGEGLKEGLRKQAEPEIKKAIKQGPKDAQSLWKAMDGVGTDENAIFSVLRSASPGMVVFIEGCYNDHYDNHATAKHPSPLRADLDDELSGDEWDIAFAYLNHQRDKAIKLELDNSQGYFNDEEERIEQVLRAASDEEIKTLMSSEDGKAIVEDVKGNLSSCDLHVVEALTDVNNLADRKIKADSIRLYDAMHGGTGIGTEEEKVKAILEACTDDKERAKLRAYYNSYYARKEIPWKVTDEQAQQKNGDGEDFLTQSLESEFSSGERTYVRALAEEKRDEQAVKMAKLVDAAAGGGTDENKLFETLDDAEFRKKYDAAKTEEEKNALLNAREDELNGKLAGLKSKAWGFDGDGVQDIIKNESGTTPITYEELLTLTWSSNKRLERPSPGQAIDKAMARMLGKRNLEAMVAQRKLATGWAEPELMLMYACHGDGTDEDWCKKALSKDGEPLSQSEVAGIKAKFKEVWGDHEALAPDGNELQTKQEPKSGKLAAELDGKEWFDVRVLLMGKPETPEQIGYVDNVRYQFVTSGSVGQGGGEVSPWSRARADMDHSHKKLQDEVAKAQTEKKELKDFDAKDGLDDNRLEVLGQYSEQSQEAYLEAVESFVDTLITIIELIGAALITVVSMGAGSPFLVAFCANLVLSGSMILLRKEMVGDAVGEDQMLIDSAKAVVMAAIQAAPEAKVIQKFTQGIGNKIAGKLIVGFGEAAEKGGMRLVGTSLEISETGAKRIASIATASVSAAGSTVASETANFLMDEKTYDMKFGEALWGENSLGARLAKGLPQAMVKAAVSDLISDAVGISNLRHRGNIGAITKHALYSALAEMGGETAGFFVYLDNYAEAGAFWEQLLKTNIKAGVSGTLTGIAMHQGRAKKLGRDFVNAHIDNDAGAIAETMKDLHEASGYMSEVEKKRLADFIAKEKPDLVPHLPDDFKRLAGTPQAAPAANDNASTTATPGKPANDPQQQAKTEEKKVDAEKKADEAVDESKSVKKPDPSQNEDDPNKPVVNDEAAKKQQAQQDEEAKKRAKETADAEEEKKRLQAAEEEKKKANVPTEEDQKKKQPVSEEEEQEKRKQQAADEEKKKAGAKPDTTPPIDPAHKPTPDQLDQGHAGIEVHSHFMGNVGAETMRDTIGGTVPNQVSKWEPLLAAIDKLPDPKKELRHHIGEDGKVAKRGASGDALELVSRTRDEIAKLKRERTMAENGTGQFKNKSKAERDAHVAELTQKIDQKAELAVKKALAASDETDFNSSYEIRDELIKGHYGQQARDGVVSGKSGDVTLKDLESPAKLREHFKDRPEVLKKIEEAADLRREQRDGSEDFKKDPKKQKRLDDLKQEIQDQFAYDEYAKQTLKRLAEDNIKYTEQSNSSAKLGKRFDEAQIEQLRAQLIAEQQKIIDDPDATPQARDKAKQLQQQLKEVQVANLSMINTSMFGERDTFADGTKDTYAGDKKRADDAKFKELVAEAVAQVGARKDIVGIDIAGAEHFRFDDLGRDRMIALHKALMEVATPDKPVVLRPHVGEGAYDPKVGERGNRDQGNNRTKDGELQHYDRARANIDKMLEAFQKIADVHGGKLPPNVIVRFGHVTHATPEQAAHMARLGIIAEVNLTSNIRTGAVDQNPEGTKKTETHVPPPEPGRLDDHSLPSLIKAGAEVILSTDAHEVMNTNLQKEYDTAKAIIEDVRNNKRGIRVPADEARAKGWSVLPGPPPHGIAYYHQLDDGDRKKFDQAYEKLFADANKYHSKRPKQDETEGGPTAFGKPKTEDDPSAKPKTEGGDDKAPNPKTRGQDGKQTEKPDPESEAEGRARRSQGVKPSSKDADATQWADPQADRKGVPENVPLSRQELRDLLNFKYGETLKGYQKTAHSQNDPEYQALLADFKKNPPKTKEEMQAFWDRSQAIATKKGDPDALLRTVYNLAEQEDFPTWFANENVQKLPKEQQAKLGNMWREEWKLYVRDMMTDQSSVEFLYQRDLLIYGDRRGPQFNDLYTKNIAKTDGDEDAAYQRIINSSMTSNKEVNKQKTGNESGIDENVAKGIRETAKDTSNVTKEDYDPTLKKKPGGSEGNGGAGGTDVDPQKLGKPNVDEDANAPKVVRAATTEAEQQDATVLKKSTDVIEDTFGQDIKKKLTPAPDGKPVLEQSPSDALIGLPTDAISPTMSAEDALQAFKEKGIPRWPALTEAERAHETKFANLAEKNMEAMVQEFFGRSKKEGELYEFEVDGAKKLYAAYGEQKDQSKGAFSKDQLETRALANHALHPTAVAIARLAFLKRLDMMAPGEQIFVTNGGCGGGKSFLTGLSQQALPDAKFKAVWDAAGEGDASENLWVLQAAQKRGLKVVYGFVENDPMKNYEGVLKRADSQGRIVDPITYARSYVRGQKNMKAFLDSPEYKAALAADPTSVQAIGLNFRQKIADKDNPNAGLLGDKGKITAKDIPDAPDEATVTEAAVKDFQKWLEDKRKAGDPNVAMWLEGGATNALKFAPALAAAAREEAATAPKQDPSKLGADDDKSAQTGKQTAKDTEADKGSKDAKPAKLIFAGSGDKSLGDSRAVPPLPGFFDLAVHGSASGFTVFHNGQWVDVSPKTVRTYLKKMGYPEGMPIRLLSCETGGAGAHAAQALANGLGVTVMAPSDTLWVWPDGRMSIGKNADDNDGNFVTFKPGTKPANDGQPPPTTTKQPSADESREQESESHDGNEGATKFSLTAAPTSRP